MSFNYIRSSLFLSLTVSFEEFYCKNSAIEKKVLQFSLYEVVLLKNRDNLAQ